MGKNILIRTSCLKTTLGKNRKNGRFVEMSIRHVGSGKDQYIFQQMHFMMQHT
jgi:hypothetical protein